MDGMGLMSAYTNIISNAISNEWEKEATEEQYRNQLRLSQQNAGMAVENWKRTNFEEQRRQMEKAGLSVGMMYNKGGGQGVSSTPPGQISKRNVVPLDFTSSIQAGLQAKQIELQEKQVEANVANTQADTTLKKQEAEQKGEGGIEYQGKAATIEQLKQQTENAQLQNEINQYEKTIKEVEAKVTQETERDMVYQVKGATSKLLDEARSAYAQANIDQATQDERLKQIEQTTKEQALRMLIMKLSGDKLVMETEETAQNITKLTGEIDKLVKETENVDARTANEKQKLVLDKIANEFMYGDEARAIRLIRAYKDTVQGLKLPGANELKAIPKIK